MIAQNNYQYSSFQPCECAVNVDYYKYRDCADETFYKKSTIIEDTRKIYALVILKYAHIDFAVSKMTIDQQKTGRPVIGDLNNTAKKLIGEPGEPKALIFELPTSEGANKTLGAWVKRAGIEKHITWHCARHSFAVNLLTSPQRPDIKTVSSTLGHTRLKHTEKYTRVVDELKKKAVNALPDYEF